MKERESSGEVLGADELSALAEQIQRGDPAAEDRLARVFYDRVRALALARTRDREIARDLTQEALMAVIGALRAGRLRSGDKLTAFVFGTVRNVVNNYFRSASRRPPSEALSPDHAAAEGRDPIENAERLRLIREAMGLLSATDRRIVLLTLVDGLKPTQIAERLGLSDEVVRARKSRALRRILDRVNSGFRASRT